MNNGVFVKLMENVRAHSNVEIVCSEKRLLRVCCKPQYKRHVIFNPDLVGVDSLKNCITLNKPIYAGFCVLDLSKTLMYDFHYNVINERPTVATLYL